jgi:Flp pilus assembly protein TadG
MRIVRDEGGQSLVEMAVLAPFLILLAVGIIDIGRYTFVAVAVVNSARAGAEYGSQNLSTALDYTGMQTAAQNDADSIPVTVSATSACVCSDGSSSTCVSTDCAASHRLTYVSVTSSATINALINYPGIKQPVFVQRTMKMQVSQ